MSIVELIVSVILSVIGVLVLSWLAFLGVAGIVLTTLADVIDDDEVLKLIGLIIGLLTGVCVMVKLGIMMYELIFGK